MSYIDNILSDYDKNVSLYEILSRKISALLEGLIRDEGLYVHSIHHRVKQRDSLSRKLNKPDASYKKLGDLTDIAGVRVITYFSSDVDRVADIIRGEFTVDTEHSIDKGALWLPLITLCSKLEQILREIARRQATGEPQSRNSNPIDSSACMGRN